MPASAPSRMSSPEAPVILSTGVARGWTWTRCYLAGDPATRRAVLVDPSTMDADERTRVDRMLSGWDVGLVVLTHGHCDHISDARWWSGRLGVPLAGHPDDLPLFNDPGLNGSEAFGRRLSTGGLDFELNHGDRLEEGVPDSVVMHLPGHSPGSIGLLFPGHLVSGDTLFKGSIGIDSLPGLGPLWGASIAVEIESIRTRIFTLPPGTVVHPGHGPDTTAGDEARSNPFAAVR